MPRAEEGHGDGARHQRVDAGQTGAPASVEEVGVGKPRPREVEDATTPIMLAQDRGSCKNVRRNISRPPPRRARRVAIPEADVEPA
jgi:hypothetical protein